MESLYICGVKLSKFCIMDKGLLRQIIYEQRSRQPINEIIRSIDNVLLTCPEVLVITGVRRCGKSVLMQQIRNTREERDYFLNFDDERLINFTVEDFQSMNEVFMEDFGVQKTYYLDEVQNVKGWERFVSRLYAQGCKVFVTGSNANLLSRELGTFLTGRHVTKELYPFSFREFLEFEKVAVQPEDFHTTRGKSLLLSKMSEYLNDGGFPQYLQSKADNYLFVLYNDILYRDVVARHKITNDKTLKEMMYHLASNATHRFTYNSLAKAINTKSPDTVKSYISFVEHTYLVRQLAKFDYSAGTQLRSPKKIYFIDNALIHKIGFNATDNFGSSLENCVCVELMRRGKEIYYYSDAGECDFVIREGGNIVDAMQVTVSMKDNATRRREIKGLVEAMTQFGLSDGTIITTEEEEELTTADNRHIHIRPAWKWLLEK